jgi:hypothetical protein
MTPEDYRAQPTAASSGIQSLRDAILFKYQSEQQQRQFDTLSGMEQQRVDETRDNNQGIRNLREDEGKEIARANQAKEGETARVNTATIENQKGVLLNSTKLTDAQVAAQLANAKFTDAQTTGQGTKNSADQVDLIAKTREVNRVAREEAGSIIARAAAAANMTIPEYAKTARGERLLDEVMLDFNSISPELLSVANIGVEKIEFGSQLLKGPEGGYAFSRVNLETGEAQPMDENSVQFTKEDAINFFTDLSGSIDPIITRARQLRGTQEQTDEANRPANERGAPGALDIIARGDNATDQLINSRGRNPDGSLSDSAERARVANITGATDPNRAAQDARTQANLDVTANEAKSQNAGLITSKIAGILPQVEASLMPEGSDNGTTGVFDKRYEVFASENEGGRIKNMADYIEQTLADPRAVSQVARTLGLSQGTNVKDWDSATLRRASELIIKSQQNVTRSNNFIGDAMVSKAEDNSKASVGGSILKAFKVGNDLGQNDMLPIPTLKQLQAAGKG